MKSISKIFSFILAGIMLTSVFGINGSAIATQLDAGNSMATATKIPEFATEYVSTLSKSDEADWFKFTTLSQDAYYNFSFKNYNIPNGHKYDTDVHLFLYDVNMQICEETEAAINASASFNLKLENSVTYYLKVCNGIPTDINTGNYEIKIDYTLDNVPNSMDRATAIAINTEYTSSLDGYGDIDYFKFIAPSNGNFTFSGTNHNVATGQRFEYRLHFYLFDKFEYLLTDFEMYENETKTSDVALEAGNEYYIKVIHDTENRMGNYSFSVSNGEVVTPPAEVTLSRIFIASMPEKTVYNIGEAFSTAGMVVKAAYSDGSETVITYYRIDNADFSTAGTKTLTVKYTESGIEKSCSFNVTVNAPANSEPNPDDKEPSNPESSVLDKVLHFLENALSWFFIALTWLINLFTEMLNTL